MVVRGDELYKGVDRICWLRKSSITASGSLLYIKRSKRVALVKPSLGENNHTHLFSLFNSVLADFGTDRKIESNLFSDSFCCELNLPLFLVFVHGDSSRTK